MIKLMGALYIFGALCILIGFVNTIALFFLFLGVVLLFGKEE